MMDAKTYDRLLVNILGGENLFHSYEGETDYLYRAHRILRNERIFGVLKRKMVVAEIKVEPASVESTHPDHSRLNYGTLTIELVDERYDGTLQRVVEKLQESFTDTIIVENGRQS